MKAYHLRLTLENNSAYIQTRLAFGNIPSDISVSRLVFMLEILLCLLDLSGSKVTENTVRER